ncbi:MAG TPA: universal stress protein [Bacteroidia bacterium]|nr:universal stress protein [Bacteroidia bacterium]
MQVIKTILVPTDFSEPAKNALEYAIVFAKKTNARIIILHIYHIPLVSARVPFVSNPHIVKENIEFAEQQLKNLEFEMTELKNVDYEIKTAGRYWMIEFPEIIQSQNADLTVMGTNGASGLKEIIIGSNTGNVIELSKQPVLAIPRQARFKEIKNLGFAYDQESIQDMSRLDILKLFTGILNAGIQIFHVKDHTKKMDAPGPSNELVTLCNYLGAAIHSYTDFYGNEIEEGINKFIDEKKIDILIMIPRRHNLFQRLFKGSLTKKMAFHSKIPLLAIPE